MPDIKTYDKGAKTLVMSKGSFKAIDPTVQPERAYEPGEIYRADAEKGSWLAGQIKARAFVLVDEDGNELDANGEPVVKADADADDKPEPESKVKTAPTKR